MDFVASVAFSSFNILVYFFAQINPKMNPRKSRLPRPTVASKIMFDGIEKLQIIDLAFNRAKIPVIGSATTIHKERAIDYLDKQQ